MLDQEFGYVAWISIDCRQVDLESRISDFPLPSEVHFKAIWLGSAVRAGFNAEGELATFLEEHQLASFESPDDWQVDDEDGWLFRVYSRGPDKIILHLERWPIGRYVA